MPHSRWPPPMILVISSSIILSALSETRQRLVPGIDGLKNQDQWKLTIFCNQQIQNKQALRYRCPSGRTSDVQNSGLLRRYACCVSLGEVGMRVLPRVLI